MCHVSFAKYIYNKHKYITHTKKQNVQHCVKNMKFDYKNILGSQ